MRERGKETVCDITKGIDLISTCDNETRVDTQANINLSIRSKERTEEMV